MAKPIRSAWSVSALILLLVSAGPVAAIFLNNSQVVPFERLFANLRTYTKKNPKDARGFYTLGRVHSLAFAREEETAMVSQPPSNPAALPGFPPYESILQRRDPTKVVSDPGLRHLAASVKHYGQSVQLAPKEPLYWLGLGWMAEQGLPYADRAAAPFVNPSAIVPKELWRQKALAAYRKAYELTVEKDLKEGSLGPGADSAISLEAAEGLIRLLNRPTATKQDQTEIGRLQATVKRLKMRPQVVTPIIFPLTGTASLEELIDPTARVTFDLAGDTRAEQWPWVRANTGILVWDPKAAGRITSGIQLFGSRTWAMYWRDGYAALASLDDNGDGSLTGKELKGLAVWHDRDGDAVSDRGEVKPVTQHGFTSITVTANGSHAGVPWNLRGIESRTGNWLPTFDWTPRSLDPVAALDPAADPTESKEKHHEARKR